MLIKFLDLDDHIKRQENFRNNLCTSSDSEDEPLSGLDGGLYPAKTLTQSKSFHQRPFERGISPSVPLRRSRTMSTPPITSEAGGGIGADASTNNLALPIIEPLQSPVYGGQKVKITLPLELAEQADLSQTIITKILSKQESKYKKSSSSSKSNSSIPSLYLLITGSCKRHLCELKITNYDSNYLCLSAYTPEHEPPEKTKVSLIVWRMGCELPNSNEIPNENLSSAMTLTSKFSYVIDQTCYLSVYLAQSVYDHDSLEDWDSIEGPQFSLAREDFTTLDQRLCAAIDHLFLPENWSLLGNAEERDLETAETAADAGLLGPRETLLHFSARLGLEKTTQLLMTKPGAVYCAQIRNQHGELANLIAKANAKLAKDNDREEIDEVTGMKKVKPDFDKIAKIIESMTSIDEPWLSAQVVNERSVIKQNMDMETWALSSSADDEGRFQPISEDLRLLSGFGILHCKLSLQGQLNSELPLSHNHPSDLQRLTANSRKPPYKHRSRPSTPPTSNSSNKTKRHNSDSNRHSRPRYEESSTPRRNRIRSTSRNRRPQSWHSSNSSLENILTDQKSKTTGRSRKEKKTASDGHNHKHKRPALSEKKTRNTEPLDKISSMQHTKSAVLPTKNNEKTLGPKTMSWSEFIAESRQLPVKKSQQKELSSHMVVSNQGSVDKFKVEKSAGLKRKLSILDRLRQKGYKPSLRKASDKDEPTEESALQSETSDRKDKDAQEMMIASEYILHDPISSEKFKNFPSRASSGASSADPNTYRERYALSRNNDGVSSDEGTGEDMLNILDGNHKEVAFDDLNFNRYASLTEAELWQDQVKNDLGKTALSPSEIKRQETIYEFIRTERSHLNTLLLLKRVWGNGLKQKPFRHINVDKLLPGISAMIYQSYRFLLLLNERQNQQYPVLQSIGDVLVKYFKDDEKDMIKAFGRFCACHGDALVYFKELVENDKKFSQFIVNTRASGSTNRLELPDCLQLAMQRITKYPLMLQKIKERTKNADLDVSKRIHELDSLNGAINKIKSIAEQVDQYVKFVSRENRLKEICKKLDTRHRSSKTVGRKTSFGKNDLTYDKRRLLYETFAVIKPGQAPKSGKKTKESIDVLLLLMTDYLVMLKPSKETKISTSKEDSVLMMPLKINTNATSYSFMKLPTEQPTVIPLRGLIVRENPTSEDMRYILSAKHAEIGLYELQFKDAETALSFTEQTRLAASFCPDDLDSPNQTTDTQPVDPAILKEIDRLENLVDKMKNLDARLVDDYNNKQDLYVEFKKLKDPSAPALKLPRFVLHDEPEKQKLTPIIEEAHQYAKDCDGSDSSKEPLLHCLAKTMLLLCQHDTWYANMQLNAAKHTYLPGSFNQIKDLNQMERFHDIEAKRFDRQRKKEKDDLKKLQAQLDRERKTLEDERKLMEAEKQAIDKQKSALDVDVVNKLKNLQLKEKSFDEKYDTEMKKFDEKQRMLMKMRDMQRYIDELEARAGYDLSPGHTSHSESPCSSKPNSFNQNDLNYPISLSKRSSSGKADKFASLHKLKRNDSTSPERPPSRSLHSRSKSNVSNKTSSTAVSDTSSQMIPLQLSAKHINQEDDYESKKKKGIFKSKEDKKLGPKTTSLVDKRFELQASTDKLDKIKSQSHSSEKKSGNVWLV